MAAQSDGIDKIVLPNPLPCDTVPPMVRSFCSSAPSDYSVSSGTAMLPSGDKMEEDEEVEEMLRQAGIAKEGTPECGIRKCRLPCIQPCANIKSFILISCLLSTTSGALTAGYLSSVITTIEKRFDIGSFVSGLIAASVEVGCIFSVIFVSYFGAKGNIPSWIGVGALFQCVGAIVFTLPHVIAKSYSVSTGINNSYKDSLCSHEHERSDLSQGHCGSLTSYNISYIFIMMLAQLLIGSGGSPLFTLGTTYIDNHVSKLRAPSYIAFIYATGALGPVLGFGLGALMLQFYVDFFTIDADNLNLTPEDPRWVGAWWGGFVICGGVLLLVSLPFFSFPRILSGETRKLVREDKSYLKRYVGMSGGSSKYGHDIKELPRAFLRLMHNPVYIVACLGICCEVCIVSGFVVFLPKYLETQFFLSKSKANLLTGGVAVPGAVVGILFGGLLLRKLHLSKKGAAQLCLALNAVALTGYGLFFILGCDNLPLAGMTQPYTSKGVLSGVNLTSACNAPCLCSSNYMEPVCGWDGLTYFSPCYAGCTHWYNTGLPLNTAAGKAYTNCSCIGSDLTNSSSRVMATGGTCAHQCSSLVPFMLMVLLMTFVVSGTQMPLLMITMRSVGDEERAFALGMQFVLLRLLAYIPAPILFGSVIDSACVVWKNQCDGHRGSCLWYDITTFRFKFVGIAATLKLVAAGFFVCVWLLLRRMDRLEREEGEKPRSDCEDDIIVVVKTSQCLTEPSCDPTSESHL